MAPGALIKVHIADDTVCLNINIYIYMQIGKVWEGTRHIVT